MSNANRVDRSTTVPTAERSVPMMRSPSQWPGTARSSASGGRSRSSVRAVTCAQAARFDRARGIRQRPPGAQAQDKLTLERSTPFDIKRLVDRFMADPHRQVVGVVDLQTLGDLLRVPRLHPSAISAMGLVPAGPRASMGAGHGGSLGPCDLPGQSLLDVVAQAGGLVTSLAVYGCRANNSAFHWATDAR